MLGTEMAERMFMLEIIVIIIMYKMLLMRMMIMI